MAMYIEDSNITAQAAWALGIVNGIGNTVSHTKDTA